MLLNIEQKLETLENKAKNVLKKGWWIRARDLMEDVEK